jgi:hypothetical protein
MPLITPSESTQELTGIEKNILRKIRNLRTTFILSTYFSLSFGLIQAWTYIFGDEPYWGLLELFRFRFFLSQFVLLLFIVITVFFLRYYLKVVHPFVKDIKTGTKEVICFLPERYKTPFFSDFYLETPLKNKSLIKISQDLYDAIPGNPTACVSLSHHARYVFMVEIAGRQMKFKGDDAFVDL